MKQLYLEYKLKTLINSVIGRRYSSGSKFVNQALGGKSNFEKDFRETHIETTYFQKVLLGLGSGYMSITDPRRGDMVAVMGESTGGMAFEYIRSKMLESEEGRQILEEKPRISSSSVDLKKLKEMPEGTLGKAYSDFLERYKYSPDERPNVRFVDDIELAYVATRYREAHDLFHTILDMPTNMLGEVTVKWVEAIQTKLPMCVTGAIFGPLRLAPKFTRSYSTRAAVDSDVLDAIKNREINVKRSPWSANVKNVEIPENIQNSIMTVLQMNDCLKMYKDCKKFQTSVYRRTLPLEGSRKQYLIECYKNKLWKRMASNPPGGNINDVINNKVKKYLKSLTNLKLTINFDKNTGLMYLMSRAPYEYSALVNIFKEISSKDPQFKPTNLFDFGSGVGTVTWAAKSFWGSSIREYVTVDASDEMNDLAFSINQPVEKKKPIVECLIQKRVFPLGSVNFDIVVSAFTFFDVGNYEQRLEQLSALWKLTSTYLVIVENGTEHGFQIIEEAREIILQQSRDFNIKCHVVAPCPHDFVCPMSTKAGGSCRFLSKYKELELRDGDYYGQTPYSYVIFKKKPRNSDDKTWPKIVDEVLLRKRHVVCNLCTGDGKLKSVIISKGKYDTETYKCARALKWGDSFPGVIHTVEKKERKKKYVKNEEEMMQEKSANDATGNFENKTVE